MTIGAWAEGDALTPTNLSTKGGGNFPDRIYNAGWTRFGSPNVAKEVRIQAAINQAAADVTGLSITNVTPSQYLSFRFQQNAVGGFAVNQPSNVTGLWAVSSSSSGWTLMRGEVGLDSTVYITSIVSGT